MAFGEVTGGAFALLVAVFVACAVEVVEALTIVLAVGVTRGWRSTLLGVTAAVAVLVGLVAALGPALANLPIDVLRVVVGGLLLVFGLQWLRKAILRTAGYTPLHDEASIYARAVKQSVDAGRSSGPAMDWYAFTLAFKSVLLEGLEVVFIGLTFGAVAGPLHGRGRCGGGYRDRRLGRCHAACAAHAGAREPSQVRRWRDADDVWPVLEHGGPWDRMAASGRSDPIDSPVCGGCVDWPGADPAAEAASPGEIPRRGCKKERIMEHVRGFGRFWWDFIVGDDPGTGRWSSSGSGAGAYRRSERP